MVALTAPFSIVAGAMALSIALHFMALLFPSLQALGALHPSLQALISPPFSTACDYGACHHPILNAAALHDALFFIAGSALWPPSSLLQAHRTLTHCSSALFS